MIEIILTLLILVQVYVIWNLNKKIETYEDVIDDYDTHLEEVTIAVTDMNNKLREIDHRGTFESDDEVGYFFKALTSLIEQLTTITGGVDDTLKETTQEEK